MKTNKSIDKRTAIIDTALELFTRQGLQQTSMAQISRESGVAVGTIYLNFKGKDDLIEGIFLHIQEEYGAAILLTPEELKLPFQEKFFKICYKSYNYYTQHPNHFYFIDTHNYSPLISVETREAGRKHYAQAISILTEAVEAGDLKQTPIVLLIRLVYNGIISLVQIKLSDNLVVTDELIQDTVDLLLNGLKT